MKFKKILNIFIIVFFIAFSALFCLGKFNSVPLIDGNTDTLQIYEWWHVECFEGGGTNRQNHLNQLAIEYQKQNPTRLFMVKLVDATQLKDLLLKNTPQLISFSEQVASIILPYLVEFNSEYDVCDNFLDSAKYNGKLMAIPYIASGYCYFTKTNCTPTQLYTANNNMHSATSIVNDIEINNGSTLSSYECYTKFVNSSDIKLLGTARDLFRISNLESLGRFSVEYQPVDAFTDLIQYIGITNSDEEILKFVEYLLSDSNQQKLANLSLFSTKHLSLYNKENYSLMENALKKCFVPNIFNN